MIINFEEVAAAAGASASDPRLKRVVRTVDARIKAFCGREFEYGQRLFTPRAYGTDHVTVAEEPIHSIDEVHVSFYGNFDSGSVQPVSGFYALRNVIYWRVGLFPDAPNAVLLKLTTGYFPASDTDPDHAALRMPDDLRDLALGVAVRRFKLSDGEVLKSESKSIGDAQHSVTRFDSGGGFFTPEEEDVLLARYARIGI